MTTPAHVVFLSGGKDSTAMALRLREMNPEQEYLYVCTPTGDELPEMVAHWERLECLLGAPIQRIMRPGGLAKCIEDNKTLPNFRIRFCTRQLKIEQAIAFFKRLGPCVSYVGLRADEESRKGGVFGDSVEQRYPLREWGWGIDDVKGYLQARGVKIPPRTDCARCPFQRLGEWWHLWHDHPEIYADAEAQEERFGHTFRSAQSDTWPAALKDLRAEFERERLPRGVRVQLSMFEDDEAPRACRVCQL
jgi:3'-phosphoadenosine 5'-phosphosulfate sulfotransferase (PAPS reductase)/FAD synthetase